MKKGLGEGQAAADPGMISFTNAGECVQERRALRSLQQACRDYSLIFY
jgi:hypothetical protein